jgi:hypothetical protein
MPPPSAGTSKPLSPTAELALINVLKSDSDPALTIPPPWGAFPFEICKFAIATTAPFATVKMLKVGVPGVRLRATVSGLTGPLERDGQMIAIWVDSTGRALVKLMDFPLIPGENLMLFKCI